MDKKPYIIVDATSVDNLQSKVNIKIEEDYKPLGSMTKGNNHYFQSMVLKSS